MGRHLPSLRGMRAFEAAARLGSLTRAALELNVTHAAVSHQIRALEAEVGIPLFLRQARGVELTAQGQRYLPALSRAFDLLDSASSELRERARHRPLVVSLSQGIAARWLMPRLHRFRLAHAEIPLALVPTSRAVDLHRDEADIGLRYGDGDWPDLDVDLLLRPRIRPVIGRRLAERRATATHAGRSPRAHPHPYRARSRLGALARGRGRARSQPRLEPLFRRLQPHLRRRLGGAGRGDGL